MADELTFKKLESTLTLPTIRESQKILNDSVAKIDEHVTEGGKELNSYRKGEIRKHLGDIIPAWLTYVKSYKVDLGDATSHQPTLDLYTKRFANYTQVNDTVGNVSGLKNAVANMIKRPETLPERIAVRAVLNYVALLCNGIGTELDTCVTHLFETPKPKRSTTSKSTTENAQPTLVPDTEEEKPTPPKRTRRRRKTTPKTDDNS